MYVGVAVQIFAGFWILLGPVRLRKQPEPA
jgi:hypothetical protein